MHIAHVCTTHITHAHATHTCTYHTYNPTRVLRRHQARILTRVFNNLPSSSVATRGRVGQTEGLPREGVGRQLRVEMTEGDAGMRKAGRDQLRPQPALHQDRLH